MRRLVSFCVFSAIFEIRDWTRRRYTGLKRVVKFQFFRFVGCVYIPSLWGFLALLDASFFFDVFFFVTLDLSSSLTTPPSSCASSLARDASFDLLLFIPLLVASIRCRNHVTF